VCLLIIYCLGQGEVRRFAHSEYGGGFLIFDRWGSGLEVWRRKRDSHLDPLCASPGPDALQERASRASSQSDVSVSQDNRGAFVPFTVICPPNDTRAYRFVYPTLLVASEDAQEAYLFDIPTAQLRQTISLRHDPPSLLHVMYVDFSARHVFVCAEGQGLLIFSRPPNGESPVLRFHPGMTNFSDVFRGRVHNIASYYKFYQPGGLSTLCECPLEREPDQSLNTASLELGSAGIYKIIILLVEHLKCDLDVVHVSPCGSHLVCVCLDGFIYIIRDFAIALKDTNSLRHSMTIIAMGTAITHMAFEEGRIAFYAAVTLYASRKPPLR
jgi:hypothetical protein